jgi:hypothetical protein
VLIFVLAFDYFEYGAMHAFIQAQNLPLDLLVYTVIENKYIEWLMPSLTIYYVFISLDPLG